MLVSVPVHDTHTPGDSVDHAELLARHVAILRGAGIDAEWRLIEGFQSVFWGFLSRFVGTYDASVFTLEDFVRDGAGSNVHIIPPLIDPLSPKNHELDRDVAAETLASFGIAESTARLGKAEAA